MIQTSFDGVVRESIHTDRHKQFREMLRARRERAHLTQGELAKRIGKVRTFVTKYEQGDRRLDVLEFLDVTEALGLDPHQLIRKLRKTKT